MEKSMEGEQDKGKENDVILMKGEWIKGSMGGRKDKKRRK
jgi:hypothetical protein